LSCGCPGARCFNIEIDYMVDTDHTHKPNQAEIDAVVQMFACQGYTLNVEISDQLTHYDVLVRDPLCLVFFEYVGEDASFGRIKLNNFDHNGQPGWHYCIFGHDYEGANCQVTGSSGLAESPGGNLIVTLGSFSNQIGTPFDRAATLAHEFGHNLGLSHCGGGDSGGPSPGSCNNVGDNPPNLGSIMSYYYQLNGVRSGQLCHGLSFDEAALFKEIDYSHGTMCTLNEAALDELFGTGMMGVDWNCSGQITGVRAQDLDWPPNSSTWCGATGGLQTLFDFDEWAFIDSTAAATASGSIPPGPAVSCITAHEVEQHRTTAGHCPQPTLRTESCEGRRMMYLQPSGSGSPNGNCDAPFNNVQSAHDAAPDGSVLFFRAGYYGQSGPIVLTKPLKIFSTPTTTDSTAVIQPP
jgi:hypothetical protein